MSVGKLTHRSGFTLIELLVTVAVAILLVTIAVPNFSSIVSRNKFSVAANDVLSSLVMARNEAIKKKENATVNLGGGGGWPLEIVVGGDTVSSRDASDNNITLSWSSPPGAVFTPVGRAVGEVSLCFFLNGVIKKEIRILPSGQIVPQDQGVFLKCI